MNVCGAFSSSLFSVKRVALGKHRGLSVRPVLRRSDTDRDHARRPHEAERGSDIVAALASVHQLAHRRADQRVEPAPPGVPVGPGAERLP